MVISARYSSLTRCCTWWLNSPRCLDQGFWSFVSPSIANKFFDECGLCADKSNSDAEYLMAPEERFSAIWSKVDRHGAVLLINEDVGVSFIRRKSHKYLASDPEGREVKMGLLGGLG